MSSRFKIFLTLTLMLTVAASSAVTTMLVLGRAASAETTAPTAVIEDPVRHAEVDNLISHIAIDPSGNVTITGNAITVKAASSATLSGATSATVTGSQTSITGGAVTAIKGGIVSIN